MKPKWNGRSWKWAALAGLLVLSACARTEPVFREPVTVEDGADRVAWGVTSRDRFGLRMPPATGSTPGQDGGQVAPPPEDTGSGLTWTAPDGWERAPSTNFRHPNFTAAEGQVECYVTILGGTGGGVAANINRWRGQLQQPDLTAAELDALPRLTVLGQEAPMVAIDGPNGSMLGVVCMLGPRAVFVKLTGPRAEVAGERERFTAFCTSLELGT